MIFIPSVIVTANVLNTPPKMEPVRPIANKRMYDNVSPSNPVPKSGTKVQEYVLARCIVQISDNQTQDGDSVTYHNDSVRQVNVQHRKSERQCQGYDHEHPSERSDTVFRSFLYLDLVSSDTFTEYDLYQTDDNRECHQVVAIHKVVLDL